MKTIHRLIIICGKSHEAAQHGEKAFVSISDSILGHNSQIGIVSSTCPFRSSLTQAVMATPTRVLKFSDGQKQLLSSLKQNFQEDNFGNFEKTFESLVSQDTENKKLVLDQVLPLRTSPHPILQ